jgi:arylsulfatase A-like enzyme
MIMSRSLNIVHFFTDQHRFDMLGCYGNKIVRTPHIDALAAEGVMFNHAYTPSAICGPARASLFTGLFPISHGIRANSEHGNTGAGPLNIRSDVTNYSQYLKAYDYYHFGKWHVEETRLPSDYGAKGHDFGGYGFPGSGLYENFIFDQGPTGNNPYQKWLQEKGFKVPKVTESYFGENPNLKIQELYARLDGAAEASIPFFLVDEAVDSLKNRKNQDQPFFMSINFWGPHTPCVLPEPYYSMYDPKKIPMDPAFEKALKGKPSHYTLISKMWGVYNLEWAEWQKIIARYYGYITMIDDAIGDYVKCLKEEGIYDNTLIIFSADHGDAMGAHKLIEKGEFMLDATYRIPMIAKHPYLKKQGVTCDEFVYLHDLCPTFIEITADIAQDTKGQSQSILNLMQGEQKLSNEREYVYGEFTQHFTPFPQRMIRTKTHKLVFNAGTDGELYDMINDPFELQNEIDNLSFQSTKRELLQKLISEMEKLEDPLVNWVKRIYEYY